MDNHHEINDRVRAALASVEAEEDVRVLFACESGSRAWGFASPDSDYDVRFLYVCRRDWYLSVDDHRDVIERPLQDELDLSGWELRKALRLLRKSNPPLLEWLQSPMVYCADAEFVRGLTEASQQFYSPRRCFAHYLHMAEGNWRDYLRGRDEVKLKKYFYVLRPLLAARWINRDLGRPPMLFSSLIDGVLEEAAVRRALDDLLARKRAAEELATAAPVEELSRFIEVELQRLQALEQPEAPPADREGLNVFFRRYALEA